MHQFDVAHVFGLVGKWIIVIAVFGLSITLSYMFFLAIAPPDKPWFPIAGLSLTEGGFLIWMFVFRMIKYHPVHKSIAGLMTLACAACSLTVASFEFYGLLASHFDLLTNPLVSQYVATFLLVIFAAHFVALIAELFVGENEKNPFVQRGGYAVSSANHNQYAALENRGETARPLASSRKKARPKEAPMSLNNRQTVITEEETESDQEEEELEPMEPIEENQKPLKNLPPIKNPQPMYQNYQPGVVKEGASILMNGVKSFIRSTKQAGRVRGITSQITDENS